MEESGMRAFIAVDVPEQIKKGIIGTAHLLNESNVRFAKPEQLHITLFFFEKATEEQLGKVKQLMEGLQTVPFDVALEGFGAFTSDHPHVIFVGISDMGALSEIYGALEPGIKQAGIEIEDRKFTPHLTVGRVKNRGRRAELEIKEFIDAHDLDKFGSFKCAEINLIKSTLTGAGPVHETLFTKKLG